MHIAYDADNLILFRVAVILIRTDMRDVFADGFFIRKVARGQRLVDDGDSNTAPLILRGEIAALAQRYLDRVEVFRCNAAVAGLRLLSEFGLGTAFYPEVAADVAAAERHRR